MSRSDLAVWDESRILAIIGEIDHELSATLDRDRIINLVLQRAVEVCGADSGVIGTLTADGRRVADLYWQGDRPETADELVAGGWSVDQGILGRVLRTGQPALIADVNLDADYVAVREATRSEMALPIKREGRVLGVLNLESDRLSAFTADHLRFMEHLLDHAGIAIENAQLFQQERQRVQMLSAIGEISREIRSGLDLKHTLGLILARIRDLVDYYIAEICLWDEAQQLLVTGASAGDPRYSAKTGGFYRLDEGFTGWIARNQQQLVIPDITTRDDVRPKIVSEETPVRSYVGLPLHTGEAFVGTLELASDQVGAYSEDHAEILRIIADQAAVAIHNARLYERTDERLQARVEELTALQRTMQELNQTLDRDRILQVVLESAIRTTGATHGNVMLSDLDSGQLTLRVTLGYSDEERAAIEAMLLHPEEGSLTLQVVESGKSCLVQDAGQESRPVCVRPDTRSALAVPILYEGAVAGIIHLRHVAAHAFDREALTFVQALAEQAAIAIGNATRFEEQVRANTALRRRAEQVGSLLTVAQKLRADVPLEDTLEEIAYAIQETVGFNCVIVNVVKGVPPRIHRVSAAGLTLAMFAEMKKVTQPAERCERILREEYRQGLCYFYPFQRRDDWGRDLDVHTPMAAIEDWREGQWHPNDLLLAPLRGSGGRLLGYISVDDPRDGQRPSHYTLEVLSLFASQAAIAVENASLYADAKQRADNLTLINQVSRTLTQAYEPSQVLDTVANGVGLLLLCEVGAVFQADSTDGRLVPTASYGAPLADVEHLSCAPREGLIGQVAATGEPLTIPDTSQEPRFVEGPQPLGSLMLVPIRAGRHVLGVLMAGCAEKRAFTDGDQVLLTTLADQAAVALETTRLFSSTQQAAVRLSLLNEIGRRAAAQLELQDMLDTTVDALHRNLGYFRVAVFLVDASGDELSVAAANDSFWPVIPPDYRQKMGQGLIGAAAHSGQTVLVNDTSRDERYIPIGEWDAPASLSAPIRAGGRVTGVLHAEADRAGDFLEEDAAALEMAADQLAVAIENARLFEQTQRRVAELATVNEIGRAISGALDPEQLAVLIYTHVSKLLDTRNFFVALYDDVEQMLHIEFLIEEGRQEPPVHLELGQGLTSYLVSSGQPLLLSHGTEEFHREHSLTPVGTPAKSWLGVPMIAEDRVIGGIVIQSYDREAAFDEGHLNLLGTIAGQAAIAYQNASLFRERERRIAEMAVLNEIAEALGSTLDMDALLELVYKQLGRLMDTTNFYIAMYDEARDEITFPFVVDPQQREEWTPRKGNEGLTGRVIQTGEPLFLPEGLAGLYKKEGREVHAGVCRSWLGVPLVAGDRVLGVIAVQSYTREHVYDEGHLRLLSTVAGQAALAVRNAQLYNEIVNFSSELEKRVEDRTRDLARALQDLTAERDRAETLYRITSELGATLDLERVLDYALQLFAEVLAVGHGTITLLDQESGFLNLRAWLGMGREDAGRSQPTPLKRGVGLAGWILEHREPALVADVAQDPRWIEIDGRGLNVRSVIAAPLSLGGGDILGVLTLGHPDVGHFNEEHLQLVTAAAAQIAFAVNNSDLYAYITEQADQLGSMLQAQRAEAAKSRAILESIADGVLVLDHNGRVLLVNPTAEELLGLSAMVLEGEHFRHMLGLGETDLQRDLAQGLYSELRTRLEATDEELAHMQARPVRLEAGNQVLAVNIAPLITAIGEAPGLVAALRDISREAEVERLKNEFISTVSHELRTPMTSIKGYTDLLFLGMVGGLTDAQRSFLQIIKSNADRLTALVNDILDISRIETGRIRLTIEALDLGKIIDEVILAFREQYRDKGVALEWSPPAELPLIRGDAARVTQVLNNLIANAWQYTMEGGRVALSARLTGDFVQVDVADTGIGIGPDDIGRVFDRFYRVDDPVVEEVGGTGLGLSIVRMFVEMLGGDIWVESELGVGSTFSFTLPLTTAEVPEVIPELLTTEAPTTLTRRQKILVVEDDHELALLLRRQLEMEGYQVLLAGSGEDALWLAREEKPQLITLDIMLPDVDGFSVLERLKAHPLTAPIPVVIVSVLSDTEKGYALGAMDYVVKPFEEDKLLRSVREALSHGEDGQQRNVLVVDDDADIRGFLEQALSYHGYRVSLASNGRQALERVQEEQPDLILLDLKMPGIDGYEVIRRLKSNEQTQPIPIIVITASPVDKERDRVRVLGLGAAQYMTKPLSVQMLIDEIKKAIVERQDE